MRPHLSDGEESNRAETPGFPMPALSISPHTTQIFEVIVKHHDPYCQIIGLSLSSNFLHPPETPPQERSMPTIVRSCVARNLPRSRAGAWLRPYPRAETGSLRDRVRRDDRGVDP